MKNKLNKLLIGVMVVSTLTFTGCGTEKVSADITSGGADTLTTITNTGAVSVQSIEVSLKSGTAYVEGDSIAKGDVVVTAIMSDGSEKPVTDWTFSGSTSLSSGDNDIEISYTAGGETVSANLEVTADPAVAAIVATIDDKERYVGDTIDRGDVHVNAQYSDGTEKPDVEDWTCSNLTLEAESNSVKIEYGGKSATVVVPAIKSTSTVVSSTATDTTIATVPDVSGNDSGTSPAVISITDPANNPAAPTGEVPATVTWSYTVIEFYDDPTGNVPLNELMHWVTHTVTTRNPGKHTVEYYQAHPWKLYNENNSDSLGSYTSFFGEPPVYEVGSPWAQLCFIAIDGHGGLDSLYNYTFRTPDDFNNFYNWNR